MKKSIARKLAAMLAFIVLTTTFASDYNSIGVKASDEIVVETEVQEEASENTEVVEDAETESEDEEQAEEANKSEENQDEQNQETEEVKAEETEQKDEVMSEDSQETSEIDQDEQNQETEEAKTEETEQEDEVKSEDGQDTEEVKQDEQTEEVKQDEQTEEVNQDEQTEEQAEESQKEEDAQQVDENADDDQETSDEATVETSTEDTSAKKTATEETADDEEAEDAEEEEKEFAAETVIDNIKVSLYAKKGVLPADAELRVEKVSAALEEQIEEKIDEETGDEVEVKETFSFDINIYSESAGDFVQPEDGTVEVRFSQIEEAKGNDTELAVYHVEDDLSDVTKMNAEVGDTEAVIDAEHFSIYTVTIIGSANIFGGKEFTFNAGVYNAETKEPIDRENNIRKVNMTSFFGNKTSAKEVAPIISGYEFSYATFEEIVITKFKNDYWGSTENLKIYAVESNGTKHEIEGNSDKEQIKFYYSKSDETNYKATGHIDLGFTNKTLEGVGDVAVIIDGVEYAMDATPDQDGELGTQKRRSLWKCEYVEKSLLWMKWYEEEWSPIDAFINSTITFKVNYKGKSYTYNATKDDNANAYERCRNAHQYNQNSFGFDYVFDFNQFAPANYKVEYYYENLEGTFDKDANVASRTGYISEEVKVTEADKTPKSDEFEFDADNTNNVLSAKFTEKDSDSNVLKVYFARKGATYTVEYYLADTKGNYPTTATSTLTTKDGALLSGKVGATITADDYKTLTEADAANFEYDSAAAGKVESITLSTEEGASNVLKLYFKRKATTYTVTYHYQYPGQKDYSYTGESIDGFVGQTVKVTDDDKAPDYVKLADLVKIPNLEELDLAEFDAANTANVLEKELTTTAEDNKLHVYFKKKDGKDAVFFYILTPENNLSVPADSKAQEDVTKFYPGKTDTDDSNYHIWAGTGTSVSSSDDDYETATGNLYNIDGVANLTSYVTIPSSVQTAINTYVASAYPNHTYNDVVWYTYKDAGDIGWHVDGYVKGVDVKVTYHKNPENTADDVTPIEDPAKTGSYTVKGANTFTYPGYVFDSWNTLSNGQGTKYEAGETTTLRNNLNLYAQWNKVNRTVTYKYETDNDTRIAGAAPVDAKADYHIGDTVTTKAAPTVNGYTFSGWKVESGLTLADNAELVGNTFTMQTDNVVLKGTYTANGNTAYRVEYYQEKLNHADDATGKDRYDQVAAATEDFKTGTTDTPVNAEDYKKAFAGFTFENYEVYGNNEDGQEEKITGDVKVLGDESLVIRYYYKRNTYKVSYQYEDSDSVAVSSIRKAAMLTDITKAPYTNADGKTLTYKFGETVTIAADATAENYVFSGWKGTAKEAEEEIADENLAKRIVKRAKEIFDNITGNQAETFVMPAGDVTIKGSFTVKAGPQKVTLSLRKYGVPNPYTGTGQPVNEYYSFSRKNGGVYCGFGEANPLVPIDGYTYVDNPVKAKGEIKYYPYVYDPTFTLANADAYNLVVSDDVKDKITKRLHDGDCGVEYKACTFDDIKWYVYKDSNNGGDLEYHFDGEIDVKCVAVYATPGRNKNYNNQFADLLNADRIDGNNYSQVGVVYLPTSVIEKGLTDDNFADVMARVQNAIVVDSKYMDTNLENKIKDVLKDNLASIVKPGDAENKIDQNITKLDENKSTAGFKKTCKFTHHLDLRVKFEKEDDTVGVAYFILGAGNELTKKPEAGPQDACYYIPRKADGKSDRIWLGTAKNIDLFDEDELSYHVDKGQYKYDYKSIFNWDNGLDLDKIEATFDEGINDTEEKAGKITEGIKAEFGEEFSIADVRWYVYKRHQSGSIHIDGYVLTNLTYDSNYPEDVTLEHATDKGAVVRYKESDTVKDNMFTVPKGYKFVGWGLKNEDGIITASEDYAIGNTVSVTNKLTLYAIWEEQEHVAIRVAVGAEGEKTLTKVYNGEEFDVDADVQVTFTTVTKDAAEITDDSAESEDGSEEAPETMDADGIVGRVSSFIGTAFDKFTKLGTINARAEEETRELTKYVEYNGKSYEVTGLKVKGGKGTHVKLGADKTIGYYDAVLVFTRDDIVIKLDGEDVTDNFDFDFDFEGAEFDGDYPIIGKLQILQRKVTMTSASDEKVDDGEPLTAKTVTENPAEPTETEGFVEGEGATYDVTGIQEGVGESANTFEYTLKEGTFADDYLIETVEGKLTITPKPEAAKDEDPGKGEDPKKDEDPNKDPAKPSDTPSDDNKTDDTKSGETQTESGESQDGQKTESENDDSNKTDDTKKDDTKKDDTKKSDSSKDAKKVDSDKSDDESSDETSSDSIQKSSEQNSSDVEAAGGQVLGASRDKVTPETEKAGVLGARRGGTDDNTNTARIFILLVAAGAAATFVVLGKKKNKEAEESK